MCSRQVGVDELMGFSRTLYVAERDVLEDRAGLDRTTALGSP